MPKYKIQSHLGFLAIFVLLGAVPAFACLCPYAVGTVEAQVKGEFDTSSAAFTGKMLGYEYKKGILYERPGATREASPGDEDRETMLVRFEADQWWKMSLPSIILIIADQSRLIKPPDDTMLLPSGIAFGCGTPFIKGEKYLIYTTGPADRLQYRICSRTAPLARAVDDLRILGKGSKPRKLAN